MKVVKRRPSTALFSPNAIIEVFPLLIMKYGRCENPSGGCETVFQIPRPIQIPGIGSVIRKSADSGKCWFFSTDTSKKAPLLTPLKRSNERKESGKGNGKREEREKNFRLKLLLSTDMIIVTTFH